MRWDYLYRYYTRYADNGGFKRLLNGGFSCDNTLIPYTPTTTACGHSSIYTGSVPSITGITGNDWWDYSVNNYVYCTQDDAVNPVGSTGTAGKMSPRNLKVTTISDELRLATNFKSKVIGIALKDRGAILTAGHSASGAYWYDTKSGDWITSSYYMTTLPQWVTEVNAQKLVDKYYAQDWNTLYPISTYTQSATDVQPYESVPFGSAGFPYNLKQFVGKNYSILPVTPYGNTFTFDLARAAVNGEKLGSGTATDLLAVSLSTPDYIGHNLGPNSVEAEDDFLRLDKDLGSFLDFLDGKIGKGAYLLFLTADHGVSAVPAFLKEHRIPAGTIDGEKITATLNKSLKDRFKVDGLVVGLTNNQVFLDRNILTSNNKLDRNAVTQWIINQLQQQPGIERAFSIESLAQTTLNPWLREVFNNSYYPSRSGDIQVVFESHYLDGFTQKGTTHGVWNPYDAHIPLLWYGWNIRPGKTAREVHITDIAPTLATLLHIQMPSGSVGKPIEEVIR